MAFISKTAFQPRIWNNRNNDTQNITGAFWNGSKTADCSAGWLCSRGACDESGVYKMTAAEAGETDLYICNPTDVRRTAVGTGLYAVGAANLGIGIPAGTRDTFTKAIPGEVYSFGIGNFTDEPDSSSRYCTVETGRLSPTSAKPTSGIWFEFYAGLPADTFTQGNTAAFERYSLIVRQ